MKNFAYFQHYVNLPVFVRLTANRSGKNYFLPSICTILSQHLLDHMQRDKDQGYLKLLYN